MAVTKSFFGIGDNATNFVLDDLECKGQEVSITHCKHGGIGKHNCHKGEQAGVLCIGIGSIVFCCC